MKARTASPAPSDQISASLYQINSAASRIANLWTNSQLNDKSGTREIDRPNKMSDPEFPFQKIGKKGKWRQRFVSNISDGEQRHWPPRPTYLPSSEENYLIRLGEEWASLDGLYEPGVQSYINKLPHGYAVWETTSGDGAQRYKRLFGHPTGKYYDSIATFLPHIMWLQHGMKCDCP